MNWPLISAHFVIGLGVAIGFHCDLMTRYPSRWRGAACCAGLLLFTLFWPVAIVSLVTMILIEKADR